MTRFSGTHLATHRVVFLTPERASADAADLRAGIDDLAGMVSDGLDCPNCLLR